MKSSIRRSRFAVGVLAVALLWSTYSTAQIPNEDPVQALAGQVRELTAVIRELRSEITQSREETREVRAELIRVLNRLDSPAPPPEWTGSATAEIETGAPPAVQEGPPATEDRIARLEENQLLLTDRISEQYQTKVESASKYRTRLSGIVMLNAFGNRGKVDSPEAPNVALQRNVLDTNGAAGLTALQSQLGFETYGPTLAGGRASAAIQFDFFGSSSSDQYSASWGGVRLRTATVRMDWPRTSVIVGQDAPFLSPLSPTSVASLAYPAFSHSGNLWTWTPQIRIEHRHSLAESDTLSLQGGLIDPFPRGSGQPAFGTRVAWSHGDPDDPLTLGIGSYYSRQNYGASRTTDGWAGTADWTVPFGDRLRLSGEFYRGRAMGALGASQGRSVVYSGAPANPSASILGVNGIGGWAQLRFKASEAIEFHVAHGQDNSYREDLLRYYSVYGDTLVGKNRSEMINLIYRPRTDLILSLEYRRLNTRRLFSESKAGQINLGMGVLF